MHVRDFTEAAPVVHALDDLKAFWAARRPAVSDIVDAEGRQYVDLVMEGGGVLGIALVGYTYALESVELRILNVCGTSAGAINALLLAAVDTPARPRSEKILRLLADADVESWIDGDADARDFVRTALAGAGTLKLLWKAGQVLDNLYGDLGLNPGDRFLEWLKDSLAAHNIRDWSGLRTRLNALPDGMVYRESGKPLSAADREVRLAMVACDVTTQTKVVFPEMADLYFGDPDAVNPAVFVRASMSIPFFFHPHRVRGLPQGAAAARRWAQVAGYKGTIPDEALLIDGGAMSNFPINLFHVPGVPPSPTFGAMLGRDREPKSIDSPIRLASAIFDAARHNADYDFITKNPDYCRLVTEIDTGDHNWLDFRLTDDAKVDLFRRGVLAAAQFLKGFDWAEYKRIRSKTISVGGMPA